MKRLLNYLPVHFLVVLILGIFIQYYYVVWQRSLTILFCCCFLFAILLLIRNKVLRTFFSLCTFFVLGIALVFINNPLNRGNYYQKHLKAQSTSILRINKVLKSGNYHHKYEAKVFQVDIVKTSGKILLNVLKDSSDAKLKVDDFILVKTPFKALISPLNPHQFDYKQYLKKQGIHQQVFINSAEFTKIEKDDFSLRGLAANFRNKIQIKLINYGFEEDTFGVINALLLGQRQEISKGLLQNYSKAGAIHILAVSGLHVGILLLILNWLFKPFTYWKHGKIFNAILIIVLLWCFAFIAGLSASVVRAVAMFSFVAFGLLFQRKNVVEFSLISSMFFLLIFDPMFLFDVGFQLSYLAVFGIIWVQPKLYAIWKPKLSVLDFFWRLFTVSVAAQVGILPLSIYYFHQFPGLFLLSNLIIIPFLGAILVGGIIVITLSLLNCLPQILVDFYGFIISLMNAFVQWISHQESFLLTGLSMSFILMITAYLVVFSLVRLLIRYSYNRLVLFLILVIGLQIVIVGENYIKHREKQFIVFHKSRSTIVGNRIGNTINLRHNLTDENLGSINLLKSYEVGEDVELVNDKTLTNVIDFKNDEILIVDSLGIYKIPNLKPKIVLIQHSPKINMRRLIKTLKPNQIIADGSNYKSYVNSWEETCLKLETPFHYTGQKGAYILNQ